MNPLRGRRLRAIDRPPVAGGGNAGVNYSMRRLLAMLLPLAAAGCFSVPASTSPVKGTEVGVIVHNYALAFRDFIRSESPGGLLPAQLQFPLPLTASEWRADDVTAPADVTATVDGVETVTRLRCDADRCARRVTRRFRDGLRIDQTVDIWYRRGATDTAADDQVTGFNSTVRYHDEVVSLTSATEPTGEKPWVVATGFGFGGGDDRVDVSRTQTYAALSSTAAPRAVEFTYSTKESAMQAAYETDGPDWRFEQKVAYTAYRNLTGGELTVEMTGGKLSATQSLTYSNGFSYVALDAAGSADDWKLGGQTLIGGAVQGRRDATQWRREIVFPAGSRFKTLVDEGTLPGAKRRGTFKRTITGLAETLSLQGTYREKAPGVWELSMTSNVGINAELTYRALDLDDVFQGVWVQPNARAASQDSADFTIFVHPDWTTLMTYTYDRSDTPFTPDEAGTVRFVPDTRGTASISVVKEKAGNTQRSVDYDLRVVAEGQKP